MESIGGEVAMPQRSVPSRPGAREERLAMGLFLFLSPHLPPTPQPEPRDDLGPFEPVTVPRRNGTAPLAAVWFPAERPRGAVLLLPLWRPAIRSFRTCFRSAYRFLDARRHAGAMPLAAVTYVSGERDRGARPEDTRALAAAAGGRCRIVPGAGHLGAIKVAGEEVLALALDTFRRAEEAPRAGLSLREVESADCPAMGGRPHEARSVRL